MSTLIDKDYFEQFTHSTGVAVEIVDTDLQLDPKHELGEKELSRNIACRFDEAQNTIYLRVKENSTISAGYIEKQMSTKVISRIIFRRGLENFFVKDEQAHFVDSLESTMRPFEKNIMLSRNADSLKYQLAYYLSTNQAVSWMIKSYIEGVTGLQLNEKYETVLQDSQMGHSRIELSESYIRAGYPQGVLSIKMDDIASYLEKQKTSFAALPEDFMTRIVNPLAIVLSGRKNSNGENKCLAITSIRMKDGSYMTLSLPRPEKVISERALNPEHRMIGGYFFSLSEASVFLSMKYSSQNPADYNRNRDEKNNILFLQETIPGRGYKYTLLDYFEDNIQKIGTEVSPGHSGSDIQSLRNVIANIRNNFENANISAKKIDVVEAKRRRNEEITREIAETEKLKPQVQEAEVKETRTSDSYKILVPSIKERKQIEIVKLAKEQHILRESSLEKLEKLNVHTVGELNTLGSRILKNKLGQGEYEQLEHFVNKTANWSIEKRVRTTPEKYFQSYDKDLARHEIRRDIEESALRCPGTKDFASMNLAYPLRKDGTPFKEFAGIALLYKSAALPSRWEGCPYFYTREELSSIGMEPLVTAEPTHIEVGGAFITVYNLRETTLFRDRPEIYNALILASAAKNEQVSMELRSIMEAFRPRFDGRKDLISEHYFSEAYNDVLSRTNILPGCSLVQVIGSEAYGDIVAKAETEKAQKERETSASKERTLTKTVTPGEWFAQLPLIQKLHALGYPDIHMAEKELVESGYFIASKGEEINLEKAMLKKFMDLSSNEKQTVMERFDAYGEMCSKLKEGRYDITELFPHKMGNLIMLEINKDQRPAILMKVGVVFRKARLDCVSPSQIYSIADALYGQMKALHRNKLVKKDQANIGSVKIPSSKPEKSITPNHK